MRKDALAGITINEMIDYSQRLWEKHKDEWAPMEPGYAYIFLLWLIGELGEVVEVIKKEGQEAVVRNRKVRHKMIEEIVDCFAYLVEVMNRFKISGGEFSQEYHKKMRYNLRRKYKRPKRLKRPRLIFR